MTIACRPVPARMPARMPAMRLSALLGALPVALLAALLAGCAAASAPPPVAAVAGPQLSPAEIVANALRDAATAEQAGDTAALARAVDVLDRAGAKVLDESGEDPLPGWRAQVPQTQAQAPWRGRPLGPGYRSGRLTGGGRDSFAQLFLSGTGASISLCAPNGDRLALRVLDPQARPVCNGQANCRWVPLFTQRYTIEVQNLGNADARYFLVVG